MKNTEKALLKRAEHCILQIIKYSTFSNDNEEKNCWSLAKYDCMHVIEWNNKFAFLMDTLEEIDKANGIESPRYSGKGLVYKANCLALKMGFSEGLSNAIFWNARNRLDNAEKNRKYNEDKELFFDFDFRHTFLYFAWYLIHKDEYEFRKRQFAAEKEDYYKYQEPLKRLKRAENVMKYAKNDCISEIKWLKTVNKLGKYANTAFSLIPAEFNRYFKGIEREYIQTCKPY